MIKLNLLRLTRVVCDNHPDRATLVPRFDLAKIVDRLVHQDDAVLVRQLAKEIYPTLIFGTPTEHPSSVKASRSPVLPGHTSLAVPGSISSEPRLDTGKSRVLNTMRRAASDNAVVPNVLTDSKSTADLTAAKSKEKSYSGLGQVTLVPIKSEGEDKPKHKRKISRSQLR